MKKKKIKEGFFCSMPDRNKKKHAAINFVVDRNVYDIYKTILKKHKFNVLAFNYIMFKEMVTRISESKMLPLDISLAYREYYSE
jgi:hypothetical protein